MSWENIEETRNRLQAALRNQEMPDRSPLSADEILANLLLSMRITKTMSLMNGTWGMIDALNAFLKDRVKQNAAMFGGDIQRRAITEESVNLAMESTIQARMVSVILESLGFEFYIRRDGKEMALPQVMLDLALRSRSHLMNAREILECIDEWAKEW